MDDKLMSLEELTAMHTQLVEKQFEGKALIIEGISIGGAPLDVIMGIADVVDSVIRLQTTIDLSALLIRTHPDNRG